MQFLYCHTCRLSELGHVHYDSGVGSFFTVTLNDGRVWKFARSKNGLYEFVHDENNSLSNDDVTDYCFITTVEGNKARYHKREVDAAETALHVLLNRPSRRTFENMVSKNLLLNYPVTVEDDKRFFRLTVLTSQLYAKNPPHLPVNRLRYRGIF